MQTYITQLIEDLTYRTNNPVAPPDYKLLHPNHHALEPQYGGMLDYIVSWECAVDEPMAKVFGIAPEAFPPPEQLTEAQATQVNEAILALWAAHRIIADYPSEVPALVLYRVLRNSWAEDGVQLITGGSMHKEFCNYYPEECPWGTEFCACKNEDWYNEDVEDMNNSVEKNPDDLPF